MHNLLFCANIPVISMTKTKIGTKQDNIFLIGYMCSGKSSVGLALSQKMGRDFYDLDEVIEQKLGVSIACIFEMKGEEFFRGLEKQTLLSLLDTIEANAILSLGGGTPCIPGILDLIKNLGRVIWLDIKPETVIQRASDDSRPLLKNINNRLSFVTEHITNRKPIYEQADIVIAAGKPVEEVVNNILNKLKVTHE